MQGQQNPQITFPIPTNPFLCKRLQARKQNKKNAVDKAQRLLEYTNYRAKIPAIFYGIFRIFGGISKVHELIKRFLAEPPPMFCGTLTGTL